MKQLNKKNFFLLFVLSAGFFFTTRAQTSFKSEIPKGWHMLNSQTSGFYGIDVDKAYEFVKSRNLKSKPVLVAVIDSGIDTTHEDLRAVLWNNPGEIPGNGTDDDKNGYIDDIYGWNFLGGKDGSNVEKDSGEGARLYHKYKNKWGGKNIEASSLTEDEKILYETWKKAEAELTGNSKSGGLELIFLKRAFAATVKSDSILRRAMGREKYTGNELEEFVSSDNEVKKAKLTLLTLFQGNDDMEKGNQEFLEGFEEYLQGEESKAIALETAPEEYRSEIVKDNYDDFNDRYYGNNNVMVSGKSASHGTHVAGIIGAVRGNDKGMDGIADNVRIMMLRAVPNGDEHDKDVALAIRYAVDNGARVINMSFGKSYSPQKKWVDEAVKYAQSRDVLLVHAAGNDSKNIDTSWNFPSPVFADGSGYASNWITVGASSDPKIDGLVAGFSNYGKQTVDVFAPGNRIYSTLPPGNNYGSQPGTSFASPMVAGLAAFIMGYYPSLSAKQVKAVIENSVQRPGIEVINPGTEEPVNLSEICRSGGIINAVEAIKLASTVKGERKAVAEKKAF